MLGLVDDALKAAGQRIDALVIERGVTQGEAAAQMGVSDTTLNVAINGRERIGRRSASRIMAWCGWTADSYDALLRGEEPAPLVLKEAHHGSERTVAASGGSLEELRRLDPELAASYDRLISDAIDLARRRRS